MIQQTITEEDIIEKHSSKNEDFSSLFPYSEFQSSLPRNIGKPGFSSNQQHSQSSFNLKPSIMRNSPQKKLFGTVSTSVNVDRPMFMRHQKGANGAKTGCLLSKNPSQMLSQSYIIYDNKKSEKNGTTDANSTRIQSFDQENQNVKSLNNLTQFDEKSYDNKNIFENKFDTIRPFTASQGKNLQMP